MELNKINRTNLTQQVSHRSARGGTIQQREGVLTSLEASIFFI